MHLFLNLVSLLQNLWIRVRINTRVYGQQLWHVCISHLNYNSIFTMRVDRRYGMCNRTERNLLTHFQVCGRSKRTRSTATDSLVGDSDRSTLRTDIFGLLHAILKCRKRYFATFMAAYITFCSVALSRTRYKVRSPIMKLVACIEKASVKTIKHLHSDNAHKYTNLSPWFSKISIAHRTSASYSAEYIALV